METLYIIAIFSLIGFFSVIIYLFMEHDKKNQKSEHCELLEERLTRLESYIYELEAKVLTPDSKLKEKIIQMYNDGKDIMLMENILNIPRLKIEMILKQYKLDNNS